MKKLVQLAIVFLFSSACSGESIGGLTPVALELTSVDGRDLPAPAGNNQAGITMLAVSGELVGGVSGANCTYLIRFQPSGGGNVAQVNGSIDPQPCPDQSEGALDVTLSFNRVDLPTGSHTYRFESP